MTLSRILFGFVLLSAVTLAQAAPVPAHPARTRSAAAIRKPQAKAAVRSTAKPGVKRITRSGRRDPFISVIREHTASSSTPGCSRGKKCLVVNQIMLRGIVQSPDGMLALVENGQKKSYFLRENDPVFNGQVVRITRDSIVFRERAVDKLGHVVTHDTVKSIGGRRPA